MAVGFFGWFFGMPVAFLAGGIFFAVVYSAWDYWKTRKAKRFPRDKSVLLDPGKQNLNVEEVIKNDRNRSDKLREFERLRTTQGGESKAPRVSSEPTGTTSVPERTILSNDARSDSAGNERITPQRVIVPQPADLYDQSVTSK